MGMRTLRSGRTMPGIPGATLVFAITASIAVSAHAQPAPATLAAPFAEFDKPGVPGCAVAVSRSGKTVASGGYGVRDIAGSDPITPDTVFDTASISKQFTAFSILLLESRGKLSLDDSITRFVPELGAAAAPITLRHLIHHMGGVRDHLQLAGLAGTRGLGDPDGNTALAILARQKGVAFPAGSAFLYSNSGYYLLALTVERVDGRIFGRFLKEEIFSPLGMTRTELMAGAPVSVRPLGRGYQVKAGGGFELSEPLSDVPGPGGIYSTVNDLLRWQDNYRTARIGGRAVIDAMRRKGVLSSGTEIYYAAGLGIEEYRGLKTISHGGSWKGYRGHLVSFPEQDLAIAILCNRTDGWPGRKADAVAEMWLEPQMAPKGPPNKAAALAPGIDDLSQVSMGPYRNAVSGSYLWLAREDGREIMRYGSLRAPLERISPGVFGFNFGQGWRYAAFDRVDGAIVMRAPFYGDPPLYTPVPAWKIADPEHYAGTYHSDEVGGDFILSVRGDGLDLSAGGKVLPLRAGAAGDLESPAIYMIVVPVTGPADHLILRDNSLGDIRFTRK
jgi:CubicO group peptidase (beta-lactamase class C family)